MTPLIIGTAGHVDHGKSTLIKALTGIDPDRLREEQQRGMTIDLGFAWIDLPKSGRVGIVDVPGHERFLKNMLAGAGGVDLALLVVAADEGVMPQTREHLDILSLLDVRGVVVAITKTDLADEELVELVKDDVLAMLAERGLPEPTVAPVSGTTGAGLDRLREVLDGMLATLAARDASAPARLPVDRVFTMTGFGTVVTGTLVSGTLTEGGTLRVMPGGLECRLRGLQVHGQKVAKAVAGQRVAANLVGVPRERLERGQVVAQPGAVEETSLCDVVLTLLPDAPALKNQARVRLHMGTAEVIARVALGSGTEVGPGQKVAAQLRCEAPIACAKGDRFVIRRYSPAVTIGGGMVSAPNVRRKKRAAIELETFEGSLKASPEEAVLAAVRASPSGVRPSDVAKSTTLPTAVVEHSVAGLGDRLVSLGGRLLTPEAWSAVRERMLGVVRKFHEQNPMEPAMPKATWAAASALGSDSKALDAALGMLVVERVLAVAGSGVKLADFAISLPPKQEALLARIENALSAAGVAVPTVFDLPRLVGLPQQAVQEILKLGTSLGRLAKVNEDLYYPAATIEGIKRQVREHIEKSGSITVASFRDISQTSRKYAVPLLEYLDSVRFTRRHGDDRVLA